MIALACSLAVVLAYQYWLREIYFYRKPVVRGWEDSEALTALYSPVEGRVVYVREIVGGQQTYMMEEKGMRRLPVPDLLAGRQYCQIGIFMTPFDNHHLLTLSPRWPVRHYENLAGVNERMWDAKDDWYMIAGKWWMNWWEKKISRYLTVNARTRFYLKGDMVMDLIYDKYVSQFTELWEPLGSRQVIGFVGRGSQVDLFVPANLLYLTVEPGDRVDHSTWLGLYSG